VQALPEQASALALGLVGFGQAVKVLPVLSQPELFAQVPDDRIDAVMVRTGQGHTPALAFIEEDGDKIVANGHSLATENDDAVPAFGTEAVIGDDLLSTRVLAEAQDAGDGRLALLGQHLPLDFGTDPVTDPNPLPLQITDHRGDERRVERGHGQANRHALFDLGGGQAIA